MDHVRELQGRLVAVAIGFVVFSAAAYPFFDSIANFLLAPLGGNNELVYLTPGGAFSFIIQVCMYVGFVLVLPIIIFNLYRFLMPVMNEAILQKAVVFTVISFLLALVGTVFAYYVSLPTALYFLTSFNLYHINPMLTVDSYFSFVMTYMIIGALLFQIPLLMLLIDGVTPLRPKKLMRYQGKIILISFIVAAIVSPTPDALNQTLLASPMVVMYSVGIILIWLGQRRPRAIATFKSNAQDRIVTLDIPVGVVPRGEKQLGNVLAKNNSAKNTTEQVFAKSPQQPLRRSVDGIVVVDSKRRPLLGSSLRRQLAVTKRPSPQHQSSPRHQYPRRSIDGFVVMSQT